MGSSEEVYEKFVGFCSISLKGENPKFLDLIKSRYEGCDDDFRTSNKMVLLLERTQKNMSDEESRKFVHLKDLLTELKINAPVKKKIKKRKHSTNLEAEAEHAEKIAKLKDCSVVMDKFAHFNAPNISSDFSSKLYPRKTCSIADGHFNKAPFIVIANDEQINTLKEEFGSGLECHIESPISPTWDSDSPLSGRGHSSGKSTLAVHHSNINDLCAPSFHTSHNTDDSKEKSPRKSVSIVGVHDIAEDGCIRTGNLSDTSNVYNSLINDSSYDQESPSWQVRDDSCHINKAELTSKLESTFKTVSIKTELSRKRSTVIVDVEMSSSTDLLIIEPSSFYKKLLEECTDTKGDHHRVLSPVDYVNNALLKSVDLTSTESPCLQTETQCRVQLDTQSNNLNALSSTIIGESTSQTFSGNMPEKLSFHKSPQSSEPFCISDCVSAIITRLESETTLEQSSSINNGCFSYDQKTLEKQCGNCDDSLKQNGDDSHRQNASTLGIRRCVDDKVPKRVPLLPSTKTDAFTSSSLFGVKRSSHGSQDKAAQEPKSFNSGGKASSSWMEDETLEPGASADEFQKDKEQSTGLDKLKQKRVIKLERLLASLRNEIEKCQDREMSLEDLDDENAAYMYEDKLKRKFVAVWNKLCEITERSVTTGRPTEKTIRYNGTRYKEINRRIQKFLNKKKMFPDFHDIKSIIKLTNKKRNMNLSSMMINDVARDAFVDIGEMLQTRRHQDFIANFGTRQTDILRSSMDPYLADPELRRKVDSNRQVAKLNLDSVITKYTQLQYDRNCGGDNEDEEVDNDDKTEDEADRNMQKKNEKEKVCGEYEPIYQDFEDFVTTASIEVDMAEEGDDDDIDTKTQQSATSCSHTVVDLQQMTDCLSPENGMSTVEKSACNSNIPALNRQMLEKINYGTKGYYLSKCSKQGDEYSRLDASNIIIIDESPNTSLVEPRQADYLKVNSQCLSTERNKREVINAQSEETNNVLKTLAKPERRGPAIKYTARKIFQNSGLIQDSKKIDCLGVSDGSKKDLPYCEKPKINAEVDNSDEDDKSSDSTSERDADDKNVDDDVDEIVMIMNMSESEFDTASSRDPSPISVVSLSSDSLTGDDDMSLEKTITAVNVCTDKLIVASPNPSNKYGLSENDNLEKRLYLHAMGIIERDNEADEKICTVLSQAIEAEDKTTSCQINTMFSSKTTEVDQQLTAGEDCIIVHGCCVGPKEAVSQDDCVIIDMPETAAQLAVIVDKASIDNEIPVRAFDSKTGISGDPINITEIESEISYFQFSTKGSSSAERKGISKKSAENDTLSRESCTQSVSNYQRFSPNAETDEVDIISVAWLQNTVKYQNNSTYNVQSRKSGDKAGSCKLQVEDLKNEQTAPENVSEKCGKLCYFESFSAEGNTESSSSDVPLTAESNILTNSLEADNEESSPVVSKTCLSNTESSCKKLLDTKKEGTIDINKSTCKYYSDAEKYYPITDSAESTLKPLNVRVGNEDVIILDDSSVDQSFSQDSSLHSQMSLPLSELPLVTENTLSVEKYITSDAEDRLLLDSQSVKDAKSNASSTEVTNKQYAQRIDYDGHKLHCPLLILKRDSLAGDLVKCVSKSDNMTVISRVVTDLQLEQSESNQLVSESVFENKENDDKIKSNSQDSIGSSSQFVEQVLKTAGDNLTAEINQECVASKHSIIEICNHHTEPNRTTIINEHYSDVRDKIVEERCMTGENRGTSDDGINNFSPKTDLNIIKAAREVNYQGIIKQPQENLSLDLINGLLIVDTVTNKDNEIGQEHKEYTQPAVSNSLLIGSVKSKTEKCASLESKQMNECVSSTGGFQDNKPFTEMQGLQHGFTYSKGSHSDMAVVTVSFNSDVDHSAKQEATLDTTVSTVNAESIKRVQKHELCVTVKATSNIKHSNNSIDSDRFMLSEKVKSACSSMRNNSDSMLCITNVRSVEEDVLSSRDLHMKTLADNNMDEQFIDNVENRAVMAGEHILLDETPLSTDSIVDAMMSGTAEDESWEQKIISFKSDADSPKNDNGENNVHLLSIDNQNSETIVDDCMASNSQNTDCDRTQFNDTENTSQLCNLDTEIGHNLDLASKEQIEEDHSDDISLVMSGSQRNFSKDTVTVEADNNCKVLMENIISATECSEAFVDISTVKISSSGYKEDTTNIRKEGDGRYEMADHYNKKKVIIGDTCSSELVSEMDGKEVLQEILSVNKCTESDSGGKLAEMAPLAPLDDEDEIKIIEELSSVKSIRTSENSKEDDRRLVDQLILDIEINKSKVIKSPSESQAILIPACQLSGEGWEICENVDTEENSTGSSNSVKKTLSEKTDSSLNTNKSKVIKSPSESQAILIPACQLSGEGWEICENVDTEENSTGSSNSVKKTLSEKTDSSLNTNSLQNVSVLSVECDEVTTGDEKMSPLSVPASLSQTTSPAEAKTKNRKRSHDESFSNKSDHDCEEENTCENETVSSCVIDVEMLTQSDKQNVVKPDFITDIISTVLSELPLSSKAVRTSTFMEENKALVKKSVFLLPQISEQGGVDDDVVIMEERQSKSTHLPVLQKGRNFSTKTSVTFKKHTPSNSYSSVARNSSTSISPLLAKKHSMTYGNTGNKIKTSTISFQSSSHGKISSFQSLPRLMPRVPIPSIQSNRTSDPASTYLNHHSSGMTNNSFPNRRSQFAGRTNSSPVCRSEIGSRSQVSNSSFPRKKSVTPVMVAPDSISRSGITSHSTGRFNLHLQQSSSARSGNAERHVSIPSLNLHAPPVRCGTMIKPSRGKDKQKKNVDDMEIILGDSDDEGGFNNTSSGLRIVSVASLSSPQSNTSSSDLNNIPNTRVGGQPLKRHRDVIIIPD